MTVIVGIYCKDGIVLGSDSALTIFNMVEQQYDNKIMKLNETSVLAFSGNLEVAQRFSETIKNVDATDACNGLNRLQCLAQISTAGITDFQYTRPWTQSVNPINTDTHFLLGKIIDNKHTLTFFDNSFQPLSINEDFWYHSSGSGAIISNPMLGFIRNVLWKDNKPPKLANGILTVVMAIQTTIDINAGGVNGPIHITVLRKNDRGVWVIESLSQEEIDEYKGNLNEALDCFKDKFEMNDSDDIDEIPEP
jgi:hypothetical protein